MKKIIFVLTLMGLCVFAFAQNDKAKAFIAKAKQCEAQKKYASALGNYYDAIVADVENTSDAVDAFQRIQNQIISGQPGFGNYNEFSLYDNWISLLKDAEAYWTTNSPYVFAFSELKKENVNYEKRTADYSVEVSTEYSEKYKTIVHNTLIEGLKKAYEDSWGKLKDWPKVSAFTEKDGASAQIYQKYGAAVVRYPNTSGKKVDLIKSYLLSLLLESFDASQRNRWNALSNNDKERIISAARLESGLASKAWYYSSYETYYGLASVTLPPYAVEDDIFFSEDNYIHSEEKNFGFTDIKLALLDENGKSFLTGPRAAIPAVGVSDNDANKYTFKNIPANLLEKIDGNDYRIAVVEAFLNYGNWDPNLEDLFTRKSLNVLPDITLSTKQNFNAEKSIAPMKLPMELIMQEKENLELEKAAFEREMRDSFQYLIENAKAEILYDLCNKIKGKKNVTVEELVQNAEKIWAEKYNSGKERYEDRKRSNISNLDIPYPEFDSNFATQIIENDAKGKLFIIDKKGSVVLTKEGLQLLKKK